MNLTFYSRKKLKVDYSNKKISFAGNNTFVQRGAIQKLEFIKQHIEFLRKEDSTGKYEEAVYSMSNQVNEHPLTGRQLAYVDGICEKLMKGMGLESYSPRHDHQTSLKFGGRNGR